MKVQVFDIGNSHLKCDIWDVEGDDAKLVYNHHTPTSRDVKENLEVVQHAYNHQEKDAVIILSMSDSIVYEAPEGYPVWIPAQEPTHPYARRETLPPYKETGKPHGEILQGVYNQLMMIKPQLVRKGFSKVRILPMSGWIAASLADNKTFNQWDLTHASNSGVFNYQIQNRFDSRFPLSGWHDCIKEIIDFGWIGKELLDSNHILEAHDGTPIMIGGHDTTFSNAVDGIHSSKPYVSCGTWLTVSVETEVSRNWKDEGARYVIAPNKALLKQLCFPSPPADKQGAAARVHDFLSKHLIPATQAPIRLFGAWRKAFLEHLSDSDDFEFYATHDNYLSEKAARYVVKHI